MKHTLAVFAFLAFALLAAPALAQQGQTVQGTVRLPGGWRIYTTVTVTDLVTDDLFTYWAGEAEGRTVIYDYYSNVWVEPPVSYQRTAISFQGKDVEGWTRAFGAGGYIDGSFFFGVDGVVYQKINIYHRHGRPYHKHRRVVYSYWLNTETLERSDSPPDFVSDNDISYFEQPTVDRVDKDKTFPEWKAEKGNPPPIDESKLSDDESAAQSDNEKPADDSRQSK
jgi:hypothetical protein